MKKINSPLCFLITVVMIATQVGCANTGANYRPIVDTQGVDLNRYEVDLRECQQYATQTMSAGQSAAAGAVAGALFGAILASAAGSRYDKNSTARVGAVSGAAGAGAEGETNQRNIIRRCLAGRGYKVLQ
jgi:outer membrane lipoprotein SlyB